MIRKLRLLQGMLYRRLCRVVPVQMNIVGKMNVFLDSKYAITCFAEIFGSRTYYPAVELLKFPPKNVLDLGAHEGLFTLFVEANIRQRFSQSAVHYSVYEANPRQINRINRNLRLGDIEQSATVYCGLVGKRNGTAKFGITSNLICSGVEPSNKAKKWIEIEYLDIENNLKHEGRGFPELIKIDIEGAEADLLESYPELFSQTCVVAVEHHGHAISSSRWREVVKNAGLTLYETTAKSGLTTSEVLINECNLLRFNSQAPDVYPQR